MNFLLVIGRTHRLLVSDVRERLGSFYWSILTSGCFWMDMDDRCCATLLWLLYVFGLVLINRITQAA
jgi:hypothetical protein